MRACNRASRSLRGGYALQNFEKRITVPRFPIKSAAKLVRNPSCFWHIWFFLGEP
jgi:hypothetical protein